MTWPTILSLVINQEDWEEDLQKEQEEEYDPEWELIQENKFWGYQYR